MYRTLTYTAAIFLLILYGCGSRKKNTINEPDNAVRVTTAPVECLTTAEPIETSGLVRAKEEITPSFKMGGIISRIYVDEGQQVVKGQLLASLDLTEIEAQASLMKSNVEKAERDLNRVKSLHADSAATLEQVQNLRTAYNMAKENFKSAQFNLNHGEIRSSCNGFVAKKWKNEGEVTPAGSPMFTLFEVNNNAWIVKSGISDKEKVRIKLKDVVEVMLDVFPDVAMTGTVSHIAVMPDPITGLYSVEVTLSPINIPLTSGYFARLKILPSVMQPLKAIPIEALLEGVGKKAFVYSINKESDKAVKREIHISHIDNSKAYVVLGLEDTENVVVRGVSFIEAGSSVIIDK